MMSLAIFAIVALMAARSFRNINISGRKVEAAMSAREAENLILQTLTRRFRAYIEGGCAVNPNNFFQNNQIGTLAALNHKNPRFYTPQYTVTTPPGQAVEDVKRCQSTPFAAGVLPNNANTFYGCFDLQTLPAARNQASKDAFAGNRGAFIEMYVKLKNLKTDTPVTCANMIQSRGFGFEIYYALHWATSAGDSVLYDSKLGTFNVGYEDET
jgi:type II secretory pathway pseudopilin PulG